MDVCVHADVLAASVRQNEHEVCGLPADARKGQKIVHPIGNPAAKTIQQLPAGSFHVARLVAVEADRINQFSNPSGRQSRHRRGH